MDIIEVCPRHGLRPAVERHIRDIYHRRFEARVTLFAPRLFATLETSGAVRCAAGVRTAPERFHSECYLERPAEQMVSAALRRPVERSELLEFTTLACIRPGDAFGFVSRLVQHGRDTGCRIALFTGTAPLRALLTRAGIAIVPVAAADGDRVADPAAWGRYYESDPLVCVAPDSPSVPPLLHAACFASARIVAPFSATAPAHA